MEELTFGQHLAKLRKAARLSQQALTDMTQIPKRTIQDWERGIATPPPYVQRFVIQELESLVAMSGAEGIEDEDYEY